MTDTEQKAALPQVMQAGGQVTAIVPQSVEEIFRVSKGVVQSGLAPYALTGKLESAEDVTRATSAVAIVIMAGAELGLPPMVALRSFTAINGRPALYGDGLINVVRRSGRAKEIKVGFVASEGDDPYGPSAYGFCRATRVDTGESDEKRFTVAQAKRAGLWQSEAMVEKTIWSGPKGQRSSRKEKVPNDSPWYRYPERMLGWRAAGFCLRELFGDVLGGITDDWEAREISGMVEINPREQSQAPALPEFDEPPPPDPNAPPPKPSQPEGEADEGDSGQVEDLPKSDAESSTPKFLEQIRETLARAKTSEEVEQFFDELDVQSTLTDDEAAMVDAFNIKADHIKRTQRLAAEANGQGDMLDSVPEATRQAVKNMGTPSASPTTF